MQILAPVLKYALLAACPLDSSVKFLEPCLPLFFAPPLPTSSSHCEGEMLTPREIQDTLHTLDSFWFKVITVRLASAEQVQILRR